MYWQNLIVDEGQDFPKEFYLFLTFMRNEDAIVEGRAVPAVTIFADDNQRMEESRNSTIAQIQAYMPEAVKYEVTINYRNSGPIARLANYFHVGMSTGTPEIPAEAKGAVPQLRQFDTLEDETLSVVRWLQNNDDLSAGIIVPDRAIQGRVMKIIRPLAEERQLKVQSYSSGSDASNVDFYSEATITVVCDKSCKGLEFDGVFIPQLQAYKTDGANEDFFRMKMYVMISRARKHLQLSYAECDEDPQVLAMLPPPEEGLIQWKN